MKKKLKNYPLKLKYLCYLLKQCGDKSGINIGNPTKINNE